MCSTGYTYGQYTKSEISSDGWNSFLVRDESESENTILRIRGGGSGGGSGRAGNFSMGGPAGGTLATGTSSLNVSPPPVRTASVSSNTSRRSTTLRGTSSALVLGNESSSGVQNSSK